MQAREWGGKLQICVRLSVPVLVLFCFHISLYVPALWDPFDFVVLQAENEMFR